MKLTSYLSKSHHGIFYFRYSTIDPFSSTRNCFKLSLRTRCPHTAKTLALSLGGFCSRLKLKGLLLSMKLEEIRELVTDDLSP